jgi:endo-1,4-beta-xylanase
MVQDTTAPSVPVLSASPNVLGPVNHQMIAVKVTAQSTDAVSAVVCRISSIESNEPDNGLGDGNASGDIGPIVGLSTMLRAERSGTGNGRIYLLTVVCRDAAGNSSSALVPVRVPKGQ